LQSRSRADSVPYSPAFTWWQSNGLASRMMSLSFIKKISNQPLFPFKKWGTR
jgi:hypothetical protein